MENGVDLGVGENRSGKLYCSKYPIPAVTATAVIRKVRPCGNGEFESQVLLVKRAEDAKAFPGAWCFPGGHINENEVPEEACKREILEETGIVLAKATLFWAAGREGRDPRGWYIDLVYFAQVPEDTEVKAGDDVIEYRWCNTLELPELAFDHNESYAKCKEIQPHLCDKRA